MNYYAGSYEQKKLKLKCRNDDAKNLFCTRLIQFGRVKKYIMKSSEF